VDNDDNKDEKKSSDSTEKEETASGDVASGESSKPDIVDSISHFFKEKLGLGDKSDKAEKDSKVWIKQILKFFTIFFSFKVKILSEKSIEGIVKYIEEKSVTKIVTLAGAGISTCKNENSF